MTGERLAGTPALLLERQAEVLALYTTLAREEPASRPAAARPRPTLSQPDAEVVAKALAAANGAAFQSLWTRGTERDIETLRLCGGAEEADPTRSVSHVPSPDPSRRARGSAIGKDRQYRMCRRVCWNQAGRG